jgi:class 3 adenylate cyclase/tetratricopeptide (TPR) repeat protein
MASADAAVRKTVTVLFCDLAGSTELGERIDPERLRALLARWYEAMRAPIERHGGTVEKFIGDAVMAVFGVPHVHEDDALRAVRAAVEMRAAVARLNDELAGPRHRPLAIRIGVNTGEVVTGDAAATLVSGDAVNTAKRLEQAAPTGEILVGPATQRLVESAVELEAVEPVSAKGKRQPVAAWRVLGTIPGATALPRRLDAPLVGRRRELAALRSELVAVGRDRSCRICTVVGPAGIGKSRLAAELLAEAPAALTARCLPYGDGISLLPLTDLVRSAGGEDAVLQAVAAEPDGELITRRICDRDGSTEELQWAVRRLLETLARDRPLVVCVEDVHWAQPAFLDLLEYVAGWARDASILLLCLARPELLEVRPRWPGTTVAVAPLGADESRQLLEALAAEWPLSPAARTQVLEAAEGNPLFVEQMVATVAERGVVEELPPTIQALLAARLDGLEPGERAVLERAAVVGRDFGRAAVAELFGGHGPAELGATLLALARKELVQPAPSIVPGDDGFRFRHALIREAAYGAMSKELRAHLHAAVGERLARLGEDEALVGYHFEQAARFRADLGVRDDAIASRAGELLGGAGLRAAARSDAAAACDLLRRSLALLPPSHARRPELLGALSTSLWSAGDADAAELTLTDAIDTARAAGDRRLEWYGRVERAARNAVTRGETQRAVATVRRAIEVFEELHDDEGLARAWRRLGLVAYSERRYADAATAFERALGHAEAGGNEQERARAADGLCSALLYGPVAVPDAVARIERILDRVGENDVLRAHASTSLAGLVAMAGEEERARVLLGAARETYDAFGLLLARIGWTQIVAVVETLAGDRNAAIAALRDGYELLDAGGLDGYRGQQAGQLAFLLATCGETRGARAFCRVCDRAGLQLPPETQAHVRAAKALVVAERAEADRLAREAVDLARRTDDLNLQASMHLTLARVGGDPAEVAAALGLYETKRNVAAAALLHAAERDIVAPT